MKLMHTTYFYAFVIGRV